MFTDNKNVRSKTKAPVQVTRQGQPAYEASIFLIPGERVVDALNDERSFIPIEDMLGRVSIVSKGDILDVVPLDARDSMAGLTSSDPYAVLGVTKENSDVEIRTAYNALISGMHPDKVQAAGLHTALVELANQHTQRIIVAFKEIVQARTRSKSASSE